MLRIGIVGCGKIAGTHVEAVRGVEGATVSTVFDVDEAAACALEASHGVSRARTWREFLDRVDAVSICVPSGMHAKVGRAAARAGKHVLVEKPIDVSVRAAQSLVDACRASGVVLSSVSQHRFSRAVQRLRLAAQGGEFGKLVQGDAYIKWYRTQAYYDSGDWRGTWRLDGGGCLMNQGIHTIDMIQWIMGGVRAVWAQTRTAAHDIEVEDVATAIVEYRNGATGVIVGSTSAYPGMAERLEVHGVHGSAIVEGDRVKLWEADPEAAGEGLYGRGVMMQPTPSVHTHQAQELEADDPSARWGEQHRLQVEDFVRAIRDGRAPFISGEAGIEPLRVILAIYASARRGGRRVELT